MSFKEGYSLKIFVDEMDKLENMPLYEWIVRRAKKQGICGATVLRGIESFGAENQLHTTKILELSMNLPIIIELVDTVENIEKFIAILDVTMKGGLMTLDKVQMRIYSEKLL